MFTKLLLLFTAITLCYPSWVVPGLDISRTSLSQANEIWSSGISPELSLLRQGFERLSNIWIERERPTKDDPNSALALFLKAHQQYFVDDELYEQLMPTIFQIEYIKYSIKDE